MKRNKRHPKLDVLYAVDDLKEFHYSNLKVNKTDYSLIARLTKGYAVTYFQTKGAKVHFNFKEFYPLVENPDLPREQWKQTPIQLRYGIVEYSDMIRDLRTWETLLTSTFMQRPFNQISADKMTDEFVEA